MKKRYSSGICQLIGVLLLLLLTFTSCSKDNSMGQLRGQWQIMTIEHPDGEIEKPAAPRLYISFDQNILQLTSSDDLENFNAKYIGQVTGESPNLTFSFPAYIGQDKLSFIMRWGIESDPAAVKVENLTGNAMTLKVGSNILTLRKF